MSEAGIVTIVCALLVAVAPALLARATLREVKKVGENVGGVAQDVGLTAAAVYHQTEELHVVKGEVAIVKQMSNGSLEKLHSEIEVLKSRNATLERLLQIAVQLRDGEGK